MTSYPIVIRNRASWIVRGFMLLWMAMLVIATAGMVTAPPRPAGHWLELILGVFWLVGVGITVVAFGMEETSLTILAPGQKRLRRGPMWRRSDVMLTNLDLHITNDYDSDNTAYYRLMIAAPRKPVAIAEGHRRDRIDAAHAMVEAGFYGYPIGESPATA